MDACPRLDNIMTSRETASSQMNNRPEVSCTLQGHGVGLGVKICRFKHCVNAKMRST